MSTFVGFVLLERADFNAEKYVKDLKEDWNLDYDFAKLYDENDDFPIVHLSILELFPAEEEALV